MPITNTSAILHNLASVKIDITANAATAVTATFVKVVDGVQQSDPVIIVITGAKVTAFFNALPSGTVSRGADIMNTLYNYAVANNLINGVVS
jgi:hypothetical protein